MVEVKSEPCLCCLWVDKWKFQFQYQEATRIVETPRESSRSNKNRRESWEAFRSNEKPWEDLLRRLEQTREASRSREKTSESSTGTLSGHCELNFAKVNSSTVLKFPSCASENHGCDVKEPNRSKTRSFIHVIGLYCYPNYLWLLSSIGYNIHLHYMILLYSEKWLYSIAL